MSAAYTYLGTVDDVLLRYPWQQQVNEQQFNQMLIRKVLLNEKVIINDGYLLNHPAARKALLDPSSSPLKALIEAKFVKILSRTGSLLDLPEKMAAQGVESFAELLKSAQWTDLKEQLKRWDSLLQSHGHYVPWPTKHISHGFDQMIERSANKKVASIGMSVVSQDEFSRVFDCYRSKNKTDKEATRTRWEQACLQVVGDAPNSRQKMCELMALACEAYHYNFAVCMSAQFPKDKILTETRYSNAFADLIQLGQPIETELPNLPSLRIPQKLPFTDAQKWKDLVDPFSDIATARKSYLDAMEAFYSGLSCEQNVEQAAQAYSKSLSTHFGQKASSDGVGKAVMGLGFLGAGIALGGDITVSASVTAGLLWLTENHLLPTVVRQFSLKDKKLFQRQNRLKTIDLTRRNALSSVAISPSLATSLAAEIPDFD